MSIADEFRALPRPDGPEEYRRIAIFAERHALTISRALRRDAAIEDPSLDLLDKMTHEAIERGHSRLVIDEVYTVLARFRESVQ